MLSRPRLIAMLCLSLAAMPAIVANADKKNSPTIKVPDKQREYQIVLQGKKFETRAAGVTPAPAYADEPKPAE